MQSNKYTSYYPNQLGCLLFISCTYGCSGKWFKGIPSQIYQCFHYFLTSAISTILTNNSQRKCIIIIYCEIISYGGCAWGVLCHVSLSVKGSRQTDSLLLLLCLCTLCWCNFSIEFITFVYKTQNCTGLYDSKYSIVWSMVYCSCTGTAIWVQSVQRPKSIPNCLVLAILRKYGVKSYCLLYCFLLFYVFKVL